MAGFADDRAERELEGVQDLTETQASQEGSSIVAVTGIGRKQGELKDLDQSFGKNRATKGFAVDASGVISSSIFTQSADHSSGTTRSRFLLKCIARCTWTRFYLRE